MLALACESDFFPASYGEVPAAAIAAFQEAAVKGEAKPLVSSAIGLTRLFRSEALFADLAEADRIASTRQTLPAL